MKIRTSTALPLLLAVAALAGSAHGAVILSTWDYQTLTTASSLAPQAGSSTVAAFNIGGGAGTLGGVNFVAGTGNTGYTSGGVTMYYSVPASSWAIDFGGAHPSAVLSDAQYTGSANGTLEFSGLTAGQQYTFQFIAADTRGGGADGRQLQIVGATLNGADVSGSSNKYRYAYTTGEYGVISTTFTADASGKVAFKPQNFDSTGTASQGTQINAIQIIAVPEPSAALLGGLGALVLLRRRRC